MLNRKAQLLAKKLIVRDVKPIKISGWSQLSDPAIWITESIYIQVGTDYVVVFRDRPTGLVIYECESNINDIMNKLRLAIDEGK